MDKLEFGKKIGSVEAVDQVFDGLTQLLGDGDTVLIRGFGKFSVVPTAARSGVNPKTGGRIQIAAGRKVKFTAAANLKTLVKGG